jgi:hypothetical protein
MEAHSEKIKLPLLSTPLTQVTLFSLPCPIHSVEAAFASSVPRPVLPAAIAEACARCKVRECALISQPYFLLGFGYGF